MFLEKSALVEVPQEFAACHAADLRCKVCSHRGPTRETLGSRVLGGVCVVGGEINRQLADDHQIDFIPRPPLDMHTSNRATVASQ